MTDIEAKALALVNEIEHDRGEDELTPRIMRGLIIDEALCRAIEQHEAFRQEVSDAVEEAIDRGFYAQALQSLIIPAPKPDPLVEAFDAVWPGIDRTMVKAIRAALEARGLEIREKNDG